MTFENDWKNVNFKFKTISSSLNWRKSWIKQQTKALTIPCNYESMLPNIGKAKGFPSKPYSLKLLTSNQQ